MDKELHRLICRELLLEHYKLVPLGGRQGKSLTAIFYRAYCIYKQRHLINGFPSMDYTEHTIFPDITRLLGLRIIEDGTERLHPDASELCMTYYNSNSSALKAMILMREKIQQFTWRTKNGETQSYYYHL